MLVGAYEKKRAEEKIRIFETLSKNTKPIKNGRDTKEVSKSMRRTRKKDAVLVGWLYVVINE